MKYLHGFIHTSSQPAIHLFDGTTLLLIRLWFFFAVADELKQIWISCEIVLYFSPSMGFSSSVWWWWLEAWTFCYGLLFSWWARLSSKTLDFDGKCGAKTVISPQLLLFTFLVIILLLLLEIKANEKKNIMEYSFEFARISLFRWKIKSIMK